MRYFKSYQSYREAWDNAYQQDPAIPLNIDIELSATCNLNCPFCYLSDKKFKKSKTKFMEYEIFTNIIGECVIEGIPAIKLNWMGEPTLHPEFNYFMQDTCGRSFFYDIIINTNGNYTPEKNYGLIYATKVIFSLDSMEKETYAKMRVGGDLKKVLDNIFGLLKLGHKNIVVRRVITKDNKHEDFKKKVRAYFKDRVDVSEHYAFDRNASNKLQVDYPGKLERVYCGYPSQRLVINTEGDVFPCCVDVFGKMKLGNIKKTTLMEIWNGKKLKKIREKLRKGKMASKACKYCQSWMSFNHKYRENVKG